jgi:hypothetical protein
VTDPIDISEPLTEICERLDLEPRLVSELVVTPHSATATVMLANDDGKKYLDHDTGLVATRTQTFEVTT